MDKFCKDCKYHVFEEHWIGFDIPRMDVDWCTKGKTEFNLISGKKTTYQAGLCSNQRYLHNNPEDPCGPEGKYWEAKDEP